ncbi:hypothetical protein P8789_20995, partial [Bacillus subtilis]|uniref:hypothetical protein n=1 Tax=Bacillus subtilis TaxID=1423 RepID=UPI002DB9084A
LSAIGCLKGVLIPVSKTGVSPIMSGGFYANGSRFVRWRFRLFYGSICFRILFVMASAFFRMLGHHDIPPTSF